MLTFENESDRDSYLPYPEHMKVVKQNKPLLDDLLVAGFWAEEQVEQTVNQLEI